MTHAPIEVVREWSVRVATAVGEMPGGLRDSIISLYLVLRGLDEIEDHAALRPARKIQLLTSFAEHVRGPESPFELTPADAVPEVSRRLPEWLALAPDPLRARTDEFAAFLAERMAYWVGRDWRMTSFDDLVAYAFDVAGAGGVAIADLQRSTFEVPVDNATFARALTSFQLGHIVRGREGDLARGVDFYPPGWTDDQLRSEARERQSDVATMLGRLGPSSVGRFWTACLSTTGTI